MLTTTNYNLKKPELTDSPPDITATNENWDTLDTTLKDAQDKANAWNTFKANGGEIGGRLTVKSLYSEGGKIYKTDAIGSNGAYVIETENGKQLVINIPSADGTKFNQIKMYASDNGDRRIVPAINGATSLGSSDSRFADIWLHSYSKTANGYTKLPNGLILQWGEHYAQLTDPAAWSMTLSITFPISFPSQCLQFIPSLQLRYTDGDWATLGASFFQTDMKANGFSGKVSFTGNGNGRQRDYRLIWMAIGF